MKWVTLIRLDGADKYSVNLPVGLSILGRGPVLNCFDKRVSRSHAMLHISESGLMKITALSALPLFLEKGKVLEKNFSVELRLGEHFSLLPDKYLFCITACPTTEGSSCSYHLSNDGVYVKQEEECIGPDTKSDFLAASDANVPPKTEKDHQADLSPRTYSKYLPKWIRWVSGYPEEELLNKQLNSDMASLQPISENKHQRSDESTHIERENYTAETAPSEATCEATCKRKYPEKWHECDQLGKPEKEAHVSSYKNTKKIKQVNDLHDSTESSPRYSTPEDNEEKRDSMIDGTSTRAAGSANPTAGFVQQEKTHVQQLPLQPRAANTGNSKEPCDEDGTRRRRRRRHHRRRAAEFAPLPLVDLGIEKNRAVRRLGDADLMLSKFLNVFLFQQNGHYVIDVNHVARGIYDLLTQPNYHRAPEAPGGASPLMEELTSDDSEEEVERPPQTPQN